jgi:hypothetical protein
VLLTPEPAGANCAAGGTKIEIGVDDDRDEVLDVPDEVDQTSYVCTPTEPNFGEFLGQQVVGGAVLQCESGVQTTAAQTTCVGPRLNGLGVADTVENGSFICGAVASAFFEGTSTLSGGSSVATWTGTTWAVASSPFVFDTITCDR